MVPRQALFGTSIALSFLAWGIIAARYLWPALHKQTRANALRPLLILHSFRFVGLAFLVPAYVGRVGVGVEPGQLGAAYFIPTVVVPLLLITHGLVFRLPLHADGAATSHGNQRAAAMR